MIFLRFFRRLLPEASLPELGLSELDLIEDLDSGMIRWRATL
jgi:hypothetical protein